jgi:two-component system, chemotaxis family, chemotaxis protein CheY
MNAANGATTVLVVDDDEDIRVAMSDTLEAEGYRVLLAEDGLDALAKLRSGGERPHLILLDLMMPNLDGSGFCAAKQKDPTISTIPVVIVSADSRVTQKAAELGVEASLAKPVRIAELVATIERFSRAT